MFRSPLFATVILCLTWLPASVQAAEVTLQNDGFTNGGTAVYQGGFVAGEVAASSFDPVGNYPQALTEVLFLYGTSQVQTIVNLYVWDDAADTAEPGSEIYSESYVVQGSATAFSSIDLSGAGVLVNGPFRIGLEFTHDGSPSVARDNDGTINQSKNFIRANGFGWYESWLLGLTGDWVIRAVVDDAVATASPPQVVAAAPLTLRPNPFNPATQVSFELPAAGPVTVRVYDVRGRQVDSVVEGLVMGAGPQQFTYQTPLPSGVYFMGASSGSWSRTVKFCVVK